jgi:hypothetical protein
MDVIEQARLGLLMGYRDSHTLSPRARPPVFPKRIPKPQKPRETRKAKRERLAFLATQPVPILFQRNPFIENRSFFVAKSYTDNVEAFCETARKRRSAIIRNLRMTGRRISHMATINLYEEHHPAILNQYFSRFTKALAERGLVGHWTIEVNRDNRLHWHLLFLDWCGTPSQLKRTVTRLLAEVRFPRFRVRAERKKKKRDLLGYCLKIKKPGFMLFEKEPDALGVKTFSKSVRDIYENKRILFVKGTGLDKHGVFGKFWAEGWTEKRFWQQIQQESALIAENMTDPRVHGLVHKMRQVLGISLKSAKWQFALDPYVPGYEHRRPSRRPLKVLLGNQARKMRRCTPRRRRAPHLLFSLFKGKTSSRRAADRSCRPKAYQSIPRPSTRDLVMVPTGRIRLCQQETDIRLPKPRSP